MLISSSSYISDKFRIEKSVFLSIILRNKANGANNYKDEEDGEKEFNKICAVSSSSLWFLKLNHKIFTLRLADTIVCEKALPISRISFSWPKIVLTKAPLDSYLLISSAILVLSALRRTWISKSSWLFPIIAVRSDVDMETGKSLF